jgi:hypothetical protein
MQPNPFFFKNKNKNKKKQKEKTPNSQKQKEEKHQTPPKNKNKKRRRKHKKDPLNSRGSIALAPLWRLQVLPELPILLLQLLLQLLRSKCRRDESVVVDVLGTTCPVFSVRVAEFRVAGFLECAAFSACCAAGVGVWVCGAEVWYLPAGDLRRGLVDLGDLVDLIESREADWAGAGEG